MGELSAGRHALEGAPIAPTEATLKALQDPLKRPPIPRDPLPDDLFDRRGPVFFLDASLFAKNLRVARKGTAGGPSDLGPLLDNAHDAARFWRLSEDLARAFVPEEIVTVSVWGVSQPSKSHPEGFGASCAVTFSVALLRRPLHNSSRRWVRGPRRHFNTRCPEGKPRVHRTCS